MLLLLLIPKKYDEVVKSTGGVQPLTDSCPDKIGSLGQMSLFSQMTNAQF